MLALTLGLGVWQIERLKWKQALLADIGRAEAAPPVPLPRAPAPFEKVEVSGRLRNDLAARYGSEVRGTAEGPKLGAQLIVPLERPGEPPLLVDRGWVPDGVAIPAAITTATITGYIRAPEPAGWSAPSPDPIQRRFWSLDPASIAAALGLPPVAPYTLVALGPPDASPAPAQALPRPANDHLGYAITWFGLSACLIGVFVIFTRRIFSPNPLPESDG